jgi:hypothetical protein
MKLESEIYHLEAKLSDKVTELMNLKVAARQRQKAVELQQIVQGVPWSSERKTRRPHNREATFLKKEDEKEKKKVEVLTSRASTGAVDNGGRFGRYLFAAGAHAAFELRE